MTTPAIDGLECRLVLSNDDFIMRNHSVHDVSVLPGVTFLDIVCRMLIAAGVDCTNAIIEDVVFAEAITTGSHTDREVRCAVRADAAGGFALEVTSRPHEQEQSDWRSNFTAKLVFRDDPVPGDIDLDALRADAEAQGDLTELYQRARREDIVHGPAMRCIGELHRGPADRPYLLARLELEQSHGDHANGFHLHPAMLDASTLAGFAQTEVSGEHPFIPMFIQSFRAPRPLTATTYVYCPRPERLAESGDVITSDYGLYDADGRFLAGFTSLTCKLIRTPELITQLRDGVTADATPPAEQPSSVAADDLGAAVRQLVARALDCPAEKIAGDVGFYDLGLDSLGVLKLGRELEELIGSSLYPTLLFEHSTIDKLVAHLQENYSITPAEPQSTAVADEETPADANPAHDAALSLHTDHWIAEDGPRRDPTDPVTRLGTGDDIGEWAGGDLLVTVAADADPIEACATVTAAAAAAVSRPGTGRVRLTVACPDASGLADALAALCRTITAETPELRCRVASGDQDDWITDAVADDSDEAELRFRDGARLVRRWTDVSIGGAARLSEGGAYLIAGGAGALGRLAADHLVRKYEARLVLVSRHEPDQQLRERIESWNRAGGDVRHVIADVSTADGADAAAVATRDAFGRIDGVLHCAGEHHDGIYLNKSAADFAAVFAAKCGGTTHLDAATARDELDFFAVYSSLSATVANPGQCDYAAANGYAEALVRARAARSDRHGHSLVIGWPYWAEGGMRAPDSTDAVPMPTAVGLAALVDVLASDANLVVVVYGSPDAPDELPSAPRTSVASQAAEAGTADDDEAIAIVGVAGKYPQADDVEQFWTNLMEGLDCIVEVPRDRWDHDAIYDTQKGREGRTYGKWGGFMSGIDEFDASFFGISRREAERMDPQERLFLMTCWHALEDAGYSPRGFAGQPVGVFAGVMWNHYQLVDGAADGVAPTAMHASIANRVSFALDLVGPSIALDTACSSSLIAVHLAVQSLRSGECTVALAGGVNANLHPQKYLQLAQGRWLSDDGRCRAFGAGGTGYVPGEGSGAVVLKTLRAAQADGDTVHAVIRSSVINHGGRTGGATVPNPASQAALIESALAQAGWDPATVGYVEAHGTGTSLGDPIEVDGLARAFGEKGSCALGSVKSNIGHLEGAAGVAGLTKVLLQLRHGMIVASLHSGELNEAIDFDSTPFVVPQQPTPWPRPNGGCRRAGISAFGAGGANAHLLIEEFVSSDNVVTGSVPMVFPLSARTDAVLRKSAGQLAARLRETSSTDESGDPDELITRIATVLRIPRDAIDPGMTLGELGVRASDLPALDAGRALDGCSLDDTIADLSPRLAARPSTGLDPADVAYTLQQGRAAMEQRLVVVADDLDGLAAELDRYAETGTGTTDCLVDAESVVPARLPDDVGRLVTTWLSGEDVDWAAPRPGSPSRHPRRVSLPGYPFDTKRYWIGGWGDGATTATANEPADEQAVAEPVNDSTPDGAGGAELEFRVLDDGVALVTLGAAMFTAELIEQVEQAFARIATDESVRSVVVTGSGPTFSMGGTPEALAALAAGEGQFSDVPFLYEGLLRCDRPVVCAVQGHAAGGGLAFGLYGDIVVLSRDSEYRANFLDYGFTPGLGATYILGRKLGNALAAEMMFTTRAYTGDELAKRGADVTVVESGDVLAVALRMARTIAKKPVEAVRALKADLAKRTLDVLPDVIAGELAMHERVLGQGAGERVRERFGQRDQDTETTEVIEQPVAPTDEPAAPAAEVDAAAVRSKIEDVLCGVLYLGRDEIDAERSFAEMGLDSVGAVEMVSRINREWELDLDSVAVYDHPTIDALTELVATEHRHALDLQTAATAPQPAPQRTPQSAPRPAEPTTDPEPPNAPANSAPAPLRIATDEPVAASVSDAPASRTVTLRALDRSDPVPEPAPEPAPAPEPDDAIAVVGMAGRFPDAPDLTAFWTNLANGTCSITEASPDRWDIAAVYDEDQNTPDRTYSKWAALLPSIDTFDERFFRLSPLDAEAMDPQQRLFLEESWHALEDAGYASDLAGPSRPWGVFVGCGAGDYADLLAAAGHGRSGQAFLGNAPSVLPARIAYLLNLTGPTMAVDTACSSSLVALDLACAAIRRGQCELALAGGVAVMSTTKMQVWTSQVGMLSPSGRCAPFDASADGIVLGEGVGVVVLKSLRRAVEDGDQIRGVLRGSGANGDGKSNGITAPNATAQAELLERVYDGCGLRPADIGYVEAHGTGTALGDPIEVKALNAVHGNEERAPGSCGLGSVKGNVGHTTMTAGIAGVIKVLLALEHEQLPPSLGFAESNDKIDLSAGPFRVITELSPWQPGPSGERIGAVSSFGFSGTNCHVVVSEAPTSDDVRVADDRPELIVVSARTKDQLRTLVARLAERVRADRPALRDVAFTLANGRATLDARAAFVAADLDELCTALDSWLDTEASDDGATEEPDDLAAMVEHARAQHDVDALQPLAEAYRAGERPDWTALYDGRDVRRIALPTYPFAAHRHWVDGAPAAQTAARANTSAATDPSRRVAAMTADENHPIASGHRVAGTTVLPAAAGISLFLAGLQQSGRTPPISLRDLRWIRPVQLAAPASLRVTADENVLTLSADGEVSATATLGTDALDHVANVDLAAVEARCPREVDVAQFYADFAASGVQYDGAFRVVNSLRAGDGEAVATLAPLSAFDDPDLGSVLHPAVVDGAMQTAAVLLQPTDGPLLPFAIRRVDVFDASAAARYSHVRAVAEHEYDVDVLTADGSVCAHIEGLTLRPGAREPAADESTATSRLVYLPEWVDAAAATPIAKPDRVAVIGDANDPLAQALLSHATGSSVVVGTGPDLHDDIPSTVCWLGSLDDSDDAAPLRSAFALVKHLLAAGASSDAMTLLAVTRGAVAPLDNEPIDPPQAAVVGLMHAVAAEYPNWRVGVVDVGRLPADSDDLAAAVLSEDCASRVVALRADRRLVSRLTPAPQQDLPTPWRERGCYVLLGGAGGIGVELAKHLARTVHARVALIGRRSADDRIRSDLEEIAQLGGEAAYWRADAADPDALRDAVDAVVQRYGPVNGALHCALQLQDRTLAAMSDADLDAALAAKVTGSVALTAALEGQPLDFLAFFSSALSFVDAPGQGNYAAAGHFEDAYAIALRRAGVPALVVNWGFWGSVGAVAAPEFRDRFADLGIEPIEPADGIAALEDALAARHPQAAIVKGKPAGLALLGVTTDNTEGGTQTADDAVTAFAELETFAERLAAERLSGPLATAIGTAQRTLPEIAEALGVDESQTPLLDAVLAVLEPPGLLQRTGEQLTLVAQAETLPGDTADELGERLCSAHPELRAHVDLVRTTVAALPDVLAGKTAGVNVLFPGGSSELVDAVYRGNPAADSFHRRLADRLVDQAREVAARDRRPAEILEIGAGTGSSTRFVIEALRDLEPLPALTYTDISRAFVNHGRDEFAAGYDALSFAVFDVEREPADQDLSVGGFDAVYASNVLHATTDIVATLRHAAALLRPGGLLLINEITRVSAFATLTFGLTPGWWRFDDDGRRLPHAPLLDTTRWTAACEAAGFTMVDLLGSADASGADAGQHVLVARAAGAEPIAAVPSGSAAPEGVDTARPAELRDRALRYVRGVFAEILKFDESELDQTTNFDAFGVDSLVSLNIVERLQADLGPLPSTLLFEQLTLAALVDHLLETHHSELADTVGASAATDEPAQQPPPSPPASPQRPPVSENSNTTPEAADVIVPAQPPSDAPEPIAIIGLTGRYPDAPDLEAFWRNLKDGHVGVHEVPAERWDWREHFDERRGTAEHTYCRWGGFIDGVDLFDPAFFGILPKEASGMDPQERLFLESAFTLLEDSGYLGPHRDVPSTGVFVGTMYGSYGRMASASGWPLGHFSDGHSAFWSIANRVSYVFDLQGPSFAVDSACSSSATAVHLACESLRRGECTMAIAGGVNLILHPAHFISLSRMGMLSPTGGCRVFDEGADGFVPGEGVGAVLLKPLSAARADGDDIWAVIRGSLANAGGRTSGYTVPNPNAQAELITHTLERSGVAADQIGYVEAHGTGTSLGDPIELSGLTRALRAAGGAEDCAIGSVKSNIGHLEGAAGIAGLTKAVLQLRHRTLVPQIAMTELNPKIDLDPALEIPTAEREWASDDVRRAGVSSFGAGGANVHIVVEEYQEGTVHLPEPQDDEQLVLLSARTEQQLRQMAAELADRLSDGRIDSLVRLAYTSQVGRAEFPARLAVLTDSIDDLLDKLHAAAAGDTDDAVIRLARGERSDLLDDEDGQEFLSGLIERRALKKLSRLWLEGTSVDWSRLWPSPLPRVRMPAYPWERKRFWLPTYDLPDTTSSNVALPAELAGQHRVREDECAPAATLLDAAYRACTTDNNESIELHDVRLHAPLLRADGNVTVERKRLDGAVTFAIRSAHDEPTLVSGTVHEQSHDGNDVVDLDELRAQCTDRRDVSSIYSGLRAGGIEHGAQLQVLREVHTGSNRVLARVATESCGGTGLPVALIDGALQSLAALDGGEPCIPTRIATLRALREANGECWVTAQELPAADGNRRFDVALVDDDGQIVLAMDEVEASPIAVATRPVEEPGEVRLLRPAWVPQERREAAYPTLALVLADTAVGEQVVARLEKAGVRCVLVSAADSFARHGDDRYSVTIDRARLRELVDDLRDRDLEPDALVQWIGGATDEAVRHELAIGLQPLLWTMSALLGGRRTSGVRAVVGYESSDLDRPAQAAIGGSLRSLALESTQFTGSLVRIIADSGESSDAGHVADVLCRELASTPNDSDDDRVTEVAVRGDERTVRELETWVAADAAAPDLSGGVCLITGGAGRLGRHLAQHLAANRDVTVVLVGRSDPDSVDLDDLVKLAGPASRVVYERGDISDADDVGRLLDRVHENYGPVKGLIHAAGVTHDGLVGIKTEDSVQDVLAPKVHGMANLDAALADEADLALVVLFSSLAAWTGNLGQTDYCFANAYLDAFALQREELRRRGERHGRTVSIGWPLWSDGGMSVDDATAALLARVWKSTPMPTDAGLDAFDRAVGSDENCVFVSYDAVDDAQQHAPVEKPPEAAVPASAPDESAVLTAVEDELREIASGFLMVDAKYVDLGADLMDTGFDSISLTELVNAVNERHDLDLLPTVLFECSNLTEFATYLVTKHAADLADVAEPVVVQDQPAADQPEPEPAPTATASDEPRPSTDAVAIVGVSAYLPGSEDLADLWAHLAAGDDLTGPVPDDRTELREHPATSTVRGGFLSADVRAFDADLFAVSPREAEMMDPQQRLFLQTVWRTIEDAGYAPSELAGSRTGLFVGMSACDYDDLLREHQVPIEAHTASGVANCILANRVSHRFDLRGPSEAIDTACSSSLVALHHAVRAIQSQECEQAIVGGVNLLLSPGLFDAFTKSGMLSADGRCKTFDADADGYGRGEGVGAVLLKPLEQALADGDHVYLVVRASAVNHGGHATSLTAPNPQAQAEVIAAAYRSADIDPASISYVETHGTGTSLGDPIEIDGLGRAFAECATGDSEGTAVALGAVKSSIGHLESAAGIAGLIKVLLCAEHGQLPPTANFTTPNPYLRLDDSRFFVNTELRVWQGVADPNGGTLRRAAISSFGFGGTNAHVVVDAWPGRDDAALDVSAPYALPLSAPSADALRAYAARVADYLDNSETPDLARVSCTLQVAREALEHRAVIVADDCYEATRLLRAVAGNEPVDRVWVGEIDQRAPKHGDTAPPADAALDELAAAWVDGKPVAWKDRWPSGAARLRVPSFPFATKQFWFESLTPTEPLTEPRAKTHEPETPEEDTVSAVAPPQKPTRTKVVLAPAAATRHPANDTEPPVPAPAAPAPEPATPAAEQVSASSTTGAVTAVLAAVLGTSAESIDAGARFGDLGLDSIFRMELVRRLNDSHGIELKSEDVYEHDSVTALSEFVDGATPPPAQDKVVADVPAPQPTSDESDQDDAADDDGHDVADQLRAFVTDATECEFDPGANFADNGFSSFDMLRVVSGLEQRFGPLPKTLLFDHPTITELADELVARYGDDAHRNLNGRHGTASTPDRSRQGAPTHAAGPLPTMHRKQEVPDEPDVAAVVAELDGKYAKEGGLAGRDIAPMVLIGHDRKGYFHVGVRDGALLAWSYVGPEDYFTDLAAELVRYCRAQGLRPNFLSLLHLDEVGGEPVTATPFGAVQRIDNLADFNLNGRQMNRLRYMVRRFERGAQSRTEEYSSGSDPDVDRQIADLVDRWTENKEMVNPYVDVVRREIREGTLADRHRVFLTYRDDELINAIVITRIASENGYLLDVEFYPPDAPLGGLEYALVHVLEKLVAEGDSVFSFGASFGVSIASCDNSAAEVEHGLEELRSVGVFGEGNFRFKNKFRPTNIPIYLCQPAEEERTPLAEIILLIASPDLTVPEAADTTVQAAAAPAPVKTESHTKDLRPAAPKRETTGAAKALAAHGYNVLAIPHDEVPTDLGTDSWAELDTPPMHQRMRELAERAPAGSAEQRPDWVPFRHITLTGSGKSATSLLCRSLRRRGRVLHNSVFPTWTVPLVECGFEPVGCGHRASSGEVDLEHLAELLDDDTDTAPVALVCIELDNNAAGGYPVSVEHLRKIKELLAGRDIPLVLDATRVVDNALATCGNDDVWTSVTELLSTADIVMMSLTKDFGTPAGGLLATDDDVLAGSIRADLRARGQDLPLTARKLALAALSDTAGVAALARTRRDAVRSLWQPLHDADLPVLDPAGAHCIVLDTARLPGTDGFKNPQMSCLSWIFSKSGVRGAPHLSADPDLHDAVRFAVPLGMDAETAAGAGEAIADALARDDGPVDLLVVEDGSDPANAAYHPVDDVPDDVAEALHEPAQPKNDNAAVLAEHCPGVERMTLDAGGGQVEVFVAGAGPALVLLSPFNIGAGVFARQFQALSDRYRVIAVHHPGVGATNDIEDVTLAGLARMVSDVLDGLDVAGPVHLAGASFGGLPALTFALTYPDRSASLTLLGSSFKIGNRVGEVNRLQVVAQEDFDAVAQGSGSADFATSRGEWEQLLLRCESMDPRTGLRYLDVFAARPDLRSQLSEIDIPTLVIHGRHDTVIPLKTAHLIHGSIDDAEYHEVAGAGHFPGLTSADEVNTAIAAFLTRCTEQVPTAAGAP